MHYWAFWRFQQQQHEDDCYWGEISRKKETHNNSQTERDRKSMLEFYNFYNSNRKSATLWVHFLEFIIHVHTPLVNCFVNAVMSTTPPQINL